MTDNGAVFITVERDDEGAWGLTFENIDHPHGDYVTPYGADRERAVRDAEELAESYRSRQFMVLLSIEKAPSDGGS